MEVPVRASVIVAVHNDASGIAATLDALSTQTLAPDEFEVLVVDDASADDTAEVVAEHARATLLRQPRRGGAYAARNRALAAARGDVIAVTDADCRPARSWLERGLSRMAHEGPDALIAGHVAMPLGPHPSLAAMVDVVHHLDQRRVVHEEGYAVTANLLAPAAAFASVGGFNVALQRGGDRDWTQRAVARGYRLVYAEEVVVVHPPRESARELLGKSLAVGRAASAMRREPAVTPGVRPYLRYDLLVPRHRHGGKLRVRENGARPSRAEWLAVGLAQIALVQLPQAAAALMADLTAAGRRAVARRRAGRAHNHPPAR
jgi:glycosyltransferase involved in cell wall biosynthesis